MEGNSGTKLMGLLWEIKSVHTHPDQNRVSSHQDFSSSNVHRKHRELVKMQVLTQQSPKTLHF